MDWRGPSSNEPQPRRRGMMRTALDVIRIFQHSFNQQRGGGERHGFYILMAKLRESLMAIRDGNCERHHQVNIPMGD